MTAIISSVAQWWRHPAAGRRCNDGAEAANDRWHVTWWPCPSVKRGVTEVSRCPLMTCDTWRVMFKLFCVMCKVLMAWDVRLSYLSCDLWAAFKESLKFDNEGFMLCLFKNHFRYMLFFGNIPEYVHYGAISGDSLATPQDLLGEVGVMPKMEQWRKSWLCWNRATWTLPADHLVKL